MSIGTSIAIYFIIWWVVLFAVLPWGVRSQEESGEVPAGTDPGAPVTPRLYRKLVWTTALAAVVFVVAYVIYAKRVLAIEQLSTWLGRPR